MKHSQKLQFVKDNWRKFLLIVALMASIFATIFYSLFSTTQAFQIAIVSDIVMIALVVFLWRDSSRPIMHLVSVDEITDQYTATLDIKVEDFVTEVTSKLQASGQEIEIWMVKGAIEEVLNAKPSLRIERKGIKARKLGE